MMRKVALNLARVSLVLSMLVVFAGSFVRMTGSGMGCPDWPKCFGHIIPPTDEDQVKWESQRFFEQGQMILHEEALWIANASFETDESFNPRNWEKYTRHDYAHFNVYHTWTEYINRLIGAATGIPTFFLFLVGLFYWKRDKVVTLFAAASLFLLGFEAWLGKLVVDGNLVPNQITIHMFGALLIVTILTLLINRLKNNTRTPIGKKTFYLFLGVLGISILQILLGTSVREEVDHLLKSGIERINIIESLPVIYAIHRSFSILVMLINGYLIYKLIKAGTGQKAYLFMWGGILLIEVLLGVGLTYLGFPKEMQPAHLIFAFLLFLVQLYVFLQVKPEKS
ncbi:MAG: COX15/CtaA family protein [Salibacter sp.]|uniref:COX15/CtaA family protein n=1 Tax=Salibacter sp. TaxID=2010995 RepID=UPI00286FCD90|nr:COX15/CtaA family protein [Salibacter sp.]MDR9399046.1 COX15/CtaA family protein [Salibacter sp.]